MTSTTARPTRRRVGRVNQVGWWVLLIICVVYGGFAAFMGGLAVGGLLGVADDVPFRAAPYWFVLHAFSGAVALITGPLQVNSRLLRRRRRWHRLTGRIYVAAVAVASVSGAAVSITFGVGPAAEAAFLALAVLWFATTVIGLWSIRDRQVARHRAWMLRSFALTCFFVTFSLWVPALEATALPDAVSYPLGVFLSWALNLIAAEIWIRSTGRPAPRAPGPRPASAASGG